MIRDAMYLRCAYLELNNWTGNGASVEHFALSARFMD